MKVLLIEDDANCLMAIRFMLKASDIELSEAMTLSEAIKQLRESEFDLVIADLKLPDSNAAETIGRLAKHTPPTAAVVAMTGLTIPLEPEIVALADAAIEKDELPGSKTFVEWLRAVVQQKKTEGRVTVEAKRITSFLQWKTAQQREAK